MSALVLCFVGFVLATGQDGYAWSAGKRTPCASARCAKTASRCKRTIALVQSDKPSCKPFKQRHKSERSEPAKRKIRSRRPFIVFDKIERITVFCAPAVAPERRLRTEQSSEHALEALFIAAGFERLFQNT